MNKMKMVFQQTLIISTAILFGLGLELLVGHLADGLAQTSIPWYIPLSIVLTGFATSLPSVFLLDDEGEKPISETKRKVVLHFFLVLGIVSGAGYLFRWYETPKQYLVIFVMYVLIYNFVWLATGWLAKSDEKAINQCLEDIRDEE